jgi:hypothetical protein
MGILKMWQSLWEGQQGPAPEGQSAATGATRMARLLGECRSSFNRVRREATALGGVDAELLRRYGFVVWGVVVEVCAGGGPGEVAVVVLYSLDEGFEGDVPGLVEVARWVKGLKTQGPDDPRSAAAAGMLRCEWANGQCLSLPLDLVGGREVYLATAAWRRAGLPGGKLADVVLPVVVLPEATPVVGVLPVVCWAGELAGEWMAAEGAEATGVERRQAPRVAAAYTAEEVLARYRSNPPTVTAAAADLMRAQMRGRLLPTTACVKISLVSNGFAVDYLDRPTGGMEVRRAQGLVMAVLARREELVRLTGVTIDAKDGQFVFSRPA